MASEVPLRGPHEPGTRAGRFHTVRGPMGASGWIQYPAAWWRARTGRTPERPWIVPASIGWLRRRIRSDWSILELGSGRSTAWFARRAGRVISFEDNEFWARAPRSGSPRPGLSNVDLQLEGRRGFPRAGRLPAGRLLRPCRHGLPGGARDDADRRLATGAEEGPPGRICCLTTPIARAMPRPSTARRLALPASSPASRTAGPRPARPASSAARANRRAPLRGPLLSEPVSRILSGAAIHLCGPPGPRRAGSTVLLGLAPGGVCHARHVTAAPVRSYRTVSPLPVRDSRVAAPSAVCSLRHFPAGFPGWALLTALALWCPDFPRRLLSVSPRLPSSPDQGTPASRLCRAVSPSLRLERPRQASWDPQVAQPPASPALHDTPGTGPGPEPSGPPRRRGSVFKRHLGRLEQTRLFFDREGGHETLRKTPTTRPSTRTSRLRIGFMLLFSGWSRT